MTSWLRPFLALMLALPVLYAGSAGAQQNLSPDQLASVRNDASFRVVTGPLGGTSAELAADLAQVLADANTVRVMPMLGSGGLQNLEDLLYLKDVDIGFVRSDVLAYVKKLGLYPDIENKIRYISKLHLEEIHVVARESVGGISDLAGKKVSFGRVVANGKPVAQLMFETLGIEAEPVFLGAQEAVQRLKAGEIDAAVITNGKPNGVISSLTAEDGLKLLPIDYADSLQELYLPASLSSEDYPNLIAEGQTVDTLATNMVMVIFNWPDNNDRYTRAETFVKAFFRQNDHAAPTGSARKVAGGQLGRRAARMGTVQTCAGLARSLW